MRSSLPAGVRPQAPGPGQESVWDYPRPPRLERSTKLVVVRAGELVVAQTREAWRVLETSHPPTWYLPRASVLERALRLSSHPSTTCEWKGAATYWDVLPDVPADVPDGPADAGPRRAYSSAVQPDKSPTPGQDGLRRAVLYAHNPGPAAAAADNPGLAAAAWSYERPTRPFREITGHLAFDPNVLTCEVDGELVRPQEGGFYAGWITDDVVGPFKGIPGSWGW